MVGPVHEFCVRHTEENNSSTGAVLIKNVVKHCWLCNDEKRYGKPCTVCNTGFDWHMLVLSRKELLWGANTEEKCISYV